MISIHVIDRQFNTSKVYIFRTGRQGAFVLATLVTLLLCVVYDTHSQSSATDVHDIYIEGMYI